MANFHQQITDVLIIGAGLSGAVAASQLARAGLRVMVLDKGSRVGGRMAARRIGEAVFDHGAQFITARSETFSSLIRDGCGRGIVREWCRGFAAAADGHPRWRGEPGMTALAEDLLQGIDVRLETRVRSVNQEGSQCSATLEDGGSITCAAMVLTAPVPQSLALLDAGQFAMPVDLKTRLEAISYERCLAVLAVLDGPSGLPRPGGMAFQEGPLSWLADNQLKGISPVPCVTLHASHAFSLEKWDADRGEAGRTLLDHAAPWIRSGVREFQTHGWLYSKPQQVEEQACAVLHASPPVIMAGDAFAGPKVEGAALSGWAAADCVLKHLCLS